MRLPEHLLSDQVWAIDPGTTKSGFAVLDITGGGGAAAPRIVTAEVLPNWDLRCMLRAGPSSPARLVIEWVQSYGMPVGREVFETVYWVGRFAEAWPHRFERVTRGSAKLHLCGSARAKDSNVSQAIRDRYPRTGGGKRPEVGTKKQPGPLFGVTSHEWPAIAVGITYAELGSTCVVDPVG